MGAGAELDNLKEYLSLYPNNILSSQWIRQLKAGGNANTKDISISSKYQSKMTEMLKLLLKWTKPGF